MTGSARDVLDLGALAPSVRRTVESTWPRILEHSAELDAARWGELVADLAARSPKAAAAFVEATPEVLGQLGAGALDEWESHGRRLAKGGWASAGLAELYFTSSAALTQVVPLEGLAHLVEVATQLSGPAPEIASAVLRDAVVTLSRLERTDRKPFLEWLEAITEASHAETDRCLERTAALLEPIDAAARSDLLELATKVTKKLGPGGFEQFSNAATALAGTNTDHAALVADARRIGESSPEAAMAYLTSLPILLDRLTPDQVRQWAEAGLELFDHGPSVEPAQSWFRLESTQANELLAELAGRVELSDVGGLLRLYAQALAGEHVTLHRRTQLADRNIGWSAPGAATTDGTAIFLPESVDTFGDHEGNFWAFKTIVTLQAARLEFGSFELEPSMSAFFGRFENRRLISVLFELAEGTRIDACAAREYRGIRPWLSRLREHAAQRRPDAAMLPRRQAFLEQLVRASLGRSETIRWDDDSDGAEAALRALAGLEQPGATVADTAEVAAILYGLAEAVPNIESPHVAQNGGEVDFCEPEQPDYRGDNKPELVQTLAEMPDPDELALLVEQSTEIDDADEASIELIVENLIDQQSADDAAESSNPSSRTRTGLTIASADGVEWFSYDEWDHLAQDYRPQRCRLGERLAEPGDAATYDEILNRRHGLIVETRRQFEQMRPEAFRRIKRIEDGPEIDLDEAISFHADKLAGAGPLPRIYQRRNKIVRDVAVGLLLDLSASTGDATAEPDRRIIDVERESAVLMIEALEAIGDTYGIYGFSGEGPGNVEFVVLKELDEPFGEPVRRRIAGIEPLQSTRMGTAIRHTISKLDASDAKVRLLILVSDGRPQDDDYGVGTDQTYAVADTTRALVEAKRSRIEPFLITVDSQGGDYLGRMCGDVGYEIVADIEALPRRLTRLYRYIAAE